MNLPKLYKKTSTGAIQEWEIRVEGPTLITRYGQVDGATQETRDTIQQGKNAGRKNATTAPEQAAAEAAAKHQKQRKKGYVDSVAAAEAGEVDAVIQGGIVPMLAESWWDHRDKVSYPVMVQPKLDGHRCVVIVDFLGVGEVAVRMWSRKREPITSMPHVWREVARVACGWPAGHRVVLDGELFVPGLKLQQISALVRPEEPVEGHERVQYHVYDQVLDANFQVRHRSVQQLLQGADPSYVQPVPTFVTLDAGAVLRHHELFKEGGYEGTVVRQLGAPYEHRRTQQLLKLKDMLDADFRILGVEEGRGKMRGHAGAVVCATADGKEFRATPEGDMAVKKDFWERRAELVGKVGEVRYQALTLDGIPQFPIFARIKENL